MVSLQRRSRRTRLTDCNACTPAAGRSPPFTTFPTRRLPAAAENGVICIVSISTAMILCQVLEYCVFHGTPDK